MLNLTSYTTEIPPLSAFPATVWRIYLDYLVYYETDSWVARIAYLCRLVAVLVCLPVLILGMLDITSYFIARTLGVVDDTKASTSDKSTVHVVDAPSIIIADEQGHPSHIIASSNQHTTTTTTSSTVLDSSRLAAGEGLRENDDDSTPGPSVFYAGEENSLKLSGVDVLSPGPSRPPSPTTSKQQHKSQDQFVATGSAVGKGDYDGLRYRGTGAN